MARFFIAHPPYVVEAPSAAEERAAERKLSLREFSCLTQAELVAQGLSPEFHDPARREEIFAILHEA